MNSSVTWLCRSVPLSRPQKWTCGFLLSATLCSLKLTFEKSKGYLRSISISRVFLPRFFFLSFSHTCPLCLFSYSSPWLLFSQKLLIQCHANKHLNYELFPSLHPAPFQFWRVLLTSNRPMAKCNINSTQLMFLESDKETALKERKKKMLGGGGT